jgi:transcriptional regulator with XRE-family HTH domain
VPIGSLRNWEHGRRTPLLDAAARIAQALGVTLDELAGLGPAQQKPRKKK